MNERIVNLKIKEAFEKLKKLIILNDYTIINEESPSILTIKQGSIWGISPRTAKKIVKFNLQPLKSETRIKYSSTLAPKWKNLTIAGYLLSSLLILLSLWITIDLEISLLNRARSFWSWIATYANTINFSALQSFSFLAKILIFFLIVILLLESIIVLYSYLNVNLIAEETLNQFE